MLPNKEVFTDYRNNHTIKETMEYFGLNRYYVEKLLTIYNIKKYHSEQIKLCPDNLTIEQVEFLNGNLLGDGSLSKLTTKSKNSLFEIKQKIDKKEYINLLFKIYSPFAKKYSEGKSIKPIYLNKKVIHNKSVECCYWCKLRTICHPAFTQLRKKWYNNCKKIIPKDLKLSWRTIAFWAFDDGSNHDGRTFAISTQAFTVEEVNFLINRIKVDLELKANINFINKKPVIVLCGDNAYKLMEEIKQFVPKCYEYKTKNRLSKYKPRRYYEEIQRYCLPY